VCRAAVRWGGGGIGGAEGEGTLESWIEAGALVTELAERHPRTSGVRELHTAVTRAS
jgi:hypothetical protein